ncbi:MAG: hypothetical protein IT384_28220 [Deltaproteobacteria bacterium]|nr:hypothetical protein [Deltaproteobacteria bacterium]
MSQTIPRLSGALALRMNGHVLEAEATARAEKLDRFSRGAYPGEFESTKAEAAYLASLGGLPRESYDPQGFLRWLGLPDTLGTPGRRDVDQLRAHRATHFDPKPDYLPGPRWLARGAQQALLALNRLSPAVTARVAGLLNVFSKDTRDDPALPRFGEPLDGEVSPLAAHERYLGCVRRRRDEEIQHAFESALHEGSIARDGRAGHGTFDIALDLGFSEPQARRLARSNFDVDTDETPYRSGTGAPRKTHGAQGLDLHWHYNRSKPGEEDTRITAARLHLDRAIALGRAGKYEAAETELGVGLHSLQDMFAHGQITPMTHALLGEFPDFIKLAPVGAYEAQQATERYLTQYLEGLEAFEGLATTQAALTAAKLDWRQVVRLPANVEAHLGEVRFFATDEALRPTDLGFGVDLDGDGRVTPDRAIDVDRDGVIGVVEREGRRSDGQDWDALPAGFDTARGVGFVRRSLLAESQGPSVVRHELMHLLVARLLEAPRSRGALVATWQGARDRGELGPSAGGMSEHLADRLSALSDGQLSGAVQRLERGVPLAEESAGTDLPLWPGRV